MAELNAFSFEQILLTDSPQPLSQSMFRNAARAFISCEGLARFRYDGGEPDSAFGHIISDGMTFSLNGELQIKAFSAVCASDIPTIISISYER